MILYGRVSFVVRDVSQHAGHGPTRKEGQSSGLLGEGELSIIVVAVRCLRWWVVVVIPFCGLPVPLLRKNVTT